MKKFADGGFTAAQEEWLGGADRTDPFILARMRAAVPDMPKDMYENNAPYKSEDQGLKLTKEMVDAERAKNGYVSSNKEPKAVERTVVKTKVTPTKKSEVIEETKAEKKPYIDIPKDTSIGLRQFRSDGVSPMERLLKSITGSKSQRTMAAEKGMKKGGSVKVSSASKRADGCAQRGKTKGRMV